MAEKLKRFGESDARREQLERTRRWMEDCGEQKNHLACAIAYFDDPNLMVIYEGGRGRFDLKHNRINPPPSLRLNPSVSNPPKS
jgi:hypothetical protein